MTVGELLEYSLFSNAVILAGTNAALNKEVVWVSSDMFSENDPVPMRFALTNQALISLIYYDESKYEGGVEKHVALLDSLGMPGIIILGGGTDRGHFDDLARSCDSHDMALVWLPKCTKPLTFYQQIYPILSTAVGYTERGSEWLSDACYHGSSLLSTSTAEHFGYVPGMQYVCVVARIKHPQALSTSELERRVRIIVDSLAVSLELNGAKVPFFVEDHRAVLFTPVEPNTSESAYRTRLMKAITDLKRRHPEVKFTASTGEVATNLAGFSKSFQAADKTLSMARRLRAGGPVYFYSDWFMYVILLSGDEQALREFAQQTLGPLLDDPALLETLTVYLVENENMTAASKKLFIHINTLRYRLEKIENLLDFDFRESSTGRFKLRFAIIVWRYFEGESRMEDGEPSQGNPSK